MSRAVRGIILVAVVAVGLGVLFAGGLFVAIEIRLNQSYHIQPTTVVTTPDEQSLVLGEELALFYCAGCHGGDLGGQVIEGPLLNGTNAPPNLTRGEGGIGSAYDDADWVRAIRHGVAPDGRALLGMPSDRFAELDDAVLGAVIAYVKDVPPVDNTLPNTTAGLMTRLNVLLGDRSLLAAELIDHDAVLARAQSQAPKPPDEEAQ